ncbi:hypothetical protein D1610_10310 [Sphingomonas gilva]|uniref:DUF2846 domain-containing protein n=2 Tax=Sphingomonas gilva TaxID=2305907 RepID=A0A396RUH8_9SPHN|nr:hypothetical protein D1610_10310 [Sphingomonas gilva]
MVAGVAHAQEAAVTASAPALPPIKTKSGVLDEPEAGKGQVVFFRPGSIMGIALGCTVREMEGAVVNEVARLGSGKYYVVQVEPGRHEYFTTGERTDTLALEIEPDETYFVKCNIGMGLVAGGANLSPSDREAFAKKAKGLKMWAGHDEDKKKPKG